MFQVNIKEKLDDDAEYEKMLKFNGFDDQIPSFFENVNKDFELYNNHKLCYTKELDKNLAYKAILKHNLYLIRKQIRNLVSKYNKKLISRRGNIAYDSKRGTLRNG